MDDGVAAVRCHEKGVPEVIVRFFETAVDPGDVDRSIELFRTQVAPAFERFAGCEGIEMLIGQEDQTGGYVEIAALSRWSSHEDIEAAIGSDDYTLALTELRRLFERTPIVRHFQAID